MEESQNDFLKFWEHIALDKKDETLIILKGHLLLEDLMSEYCASRVENEKPLEDARLTFMQLMHLVKALQKLKSLEHLMKRKERIKRLRIQQ